MFCHIHFGKRFGSSSQLKYTYHPSCVKGLLTIAVFRIALSLKWQKGLSDGEQTHPYTQIQLNTRQSGKGADWGYAATWMNLQCALMEAKGQKSHFVAMKIAARQNHEDQTDQQLVGPREEMRGWLEHGLRGSWNNNILCINYCHWLVNCSPLINRRTVHLKGWFTEGKLSLRVWFWNKQ